MRYFRVVWFCVFGIGATLWILQPAPLEKCLSAPWWILSAAVLGFIVAWATLDKLLRRGEPAEEIPTRLPRWADILMGTYAFLFPLTYDHFLKSWLNTRYGVEGRAEQVLAYFAFPILVVFVSEIHEHVKRVEDVAAD